MSNQAIPSLLTLLTILAGAGVAVAQDEERGAHQQHEQSPPHGREHRAEAYEPPLPEGISLDEMLDYADKPAPDSWPAPIHDNAIFSFTQFELFEYRIADDGRDELGWDAQGWIGNDDHKFWWKTEGDTVLDGPDEGEADLQALYAMPLSAFWYVQVGARYEQAWEPGSTDERFSAVLGVQGIAPYKFDVEPSLYITDDGDVLAQFTASYDLYLTQRLVLQPRVELSAAAQDVPESGLGAGITSGNFDLRLRYEITREFAPYIGVRYERLFGETADIATRSGSEDHNVFLLLGFRLAF